ncbi:MAG TPA: hypothetical protein VLF60_03125 [Candidatus Saccharimonadales bacterium]|nr:hypothetical protein [Candidatus Saccharimonadales bacterium]
MPKGKFFCFSPPVMLATFAVEIGMALYVLWRYKLSALTRLVMLTLIFLAVFQMAEYMVCGGFGMSAKTWSRIGYVAITLLPALGMHIVHIIAGRKSRVMVGLVYAAALVCVIYFAFASSAINGQECLGNYVIFQLARWASWLYVGYYYGLVAAGVGLCIRWSQTIRRQATRHALRLFAVGYLTFVVPTIAANLFSPSTLRGVPSIMCGFAVIFAIILTFGVLPLVDSSKLKQHTSH